MPIYDLIAVGGGTAGLVASAGAAGLGARVALIESDRLGGECLWTGCVPSKAMIAAARAARVALSSAVLGVDAEARVDFAGVMAWVREAQRRIAPHDSPERFRSLGVDVIEGHARFTGERTLSVDGRQLTGRHIVIATGSRPAVPPLAGLESVPFLTNETIFSIERLPQRLLVIGGGPIGLELAQAFARLGSAVHVVEAEPALLPREDHELAETLGTRLQSEGVELHLATKVTAVLRQGTGIAARIKARDDAERELVADALLISVGRVSNVDALDAERGGVEVDERGVVVDDSLRTTAKGTWAAGDVTGGLRFTHVADYQARLVLRNAFFPLTSRADYATVPWVTYTDPELAHVGLTEREACARYGDDVRVWRRSLSDLDRAVVDAQPDGIVKLVTSRRGRILGGHILGPRAGEMIAEVALAMRHGLSIGAISRTVHAYPTYSEAVRHAADDFYRAKLRGIAKTLTRWIVRR